MIGKINDGTSFNNNAMMNNNRVMMSNKANDMQQG